MFTLCITSLPCMDDGRENPIIILVDCNLIQPALRNGNRHKYVTG